MLIVDDIDAHGDANLTRLTVLKKWFEAPGRLVPFALWIAGRAASRKGKIKGEAAELFREARALLAGLERVHPALEHDAAARLHARLVEFQNEYRHDQWGSVRIVHNWQLLLVEKGLAIALADGRSSSDGYKLAAQASPPNWAPRQDNRSQRSTSETTPVPFSCPRKLTPGFCQSLQLNAVDTASRPYATNGVQPSRRRSDEL